MLSTGQICKKKFICLVMSGMTSQADLDVATDKLFDQLYQNFCDLIGYMIYISGHKQTLVRFRQRIKDGERRYF